MSRPPGPVTWLRRLSASIAFLTVLPVPGRKEVEGCSAFFPVSGWLIGGAAFGVWLLARGLPALPRAFLVVTLWELSTRFLHLDGLADTADAFLAGGGRERLLAIMDDSRTGAFGAAAVSLALAGKLALVASLSRPGAAGILCAAVTGRFALSLLSSLFRPARDEGLGSRVVGSSGALTLAVATLLAMLPLGLLFRLGALAAAAALLPALALAGYARLRVGGLTGDILGACLEITELAVLFTFT